MGETLTAAKVREMTGEEFNAVLDRAIRWNGDGTETGDLSCMIELWERSHLQHWLTDTLAAAEGERDALYAACSAALARLDYLQDLWGKEGVTDGLVRQLREAIAKASPSP